MSGTESQKLSFQAMIFTAVLIPTYVAAAMLTNSAAILTDLFATFFDLTALTACWLVLRLANKAHAAKYAYGLGKLENLAELIIAILQMILVIIAGMSATSHLLHPQSVEGAELGLAVTAAAIIGNILFYMKATRLARQTKSPVLTAQARVHIISAISSGAVFVVTAILIFYPKVPVLYYLDPIASFVVIGFMLYNIFAMLTNSVTSLLDQAIDEAGQLRILRVLTSHFDDYQELGDIRTRQSGGKLSVELCLAFNDSWTVAEARRVVARLTDAVTREFREAGDEVDVAIVLMPSKPATS